MTLEELLAQAAEKGLTHLTLWSVASADGKKVYWSARATPSTQHSYTAADGIDPIAAVKKVLTDLPKAPKRKVTAAVKSRGTENPHPPANDPAQTADDWMLK